MDELLNISMDFKKWLAEWEGFKPTDARDYTNGEPDSAGQTMPVRSKYSTKASPKSFKKDGQNITQPESLFGFSKEDKLLIMQNKQNK